MGAHLLDIENEAELQFIRKITYIENLLESKNDFLKKTWWLPKQDYYNIYSYKYISLGSDIHFISSETPTEDYWKCAIRNDTIYDTYRGPYCYSLKLAKSFNTPNLNLIYNEDCDLKDEDRGVICKRPVQLTGKNDFENSSNETVEKKIECGEWEFELSAQSECFCYKILYDEYPLRTWNDAYERCQSYDLELLSIDSEEEAQKIEQLLSKDSRYISHYLGAEELWYPIGLHKSMFGEGWTWSSSKQLNITENSTVQWGPNLPDNKCGHDECAAIYRVNWNGNNHLEIRDIPCDFSLKKTSFLTLCKQNKRSNCNQIAKYPSPTGKIRIHF